MIFSAQDRAAAILETLFRRIERLNLEFSRAKTEGRNTAPFHRRARSLSAAYLALKEEVAR